MKELIEGILHPQHKELNTCAAAENRQTRRPERFMGRFQPSRQTHQFYPFIMERPPSSYPNANLSWPPLAQAVENAPSCKNPFETRKHRPLKLCTHSSIKSKSANLRTAKRPLNRKSLSGLDRLCQHANQLKHQRNPKPSGAARSV